MATKTQTSLGIECPKCGCRHFHVIYTRPKPGAIVRLRECRHCGRRLLTREQAPGVPPV